MSHQVHGSFPRNKIRLDFIEKIVADDFVSAPVKSFAVQYLKHEIRKPLDISPWLVLTLSPDASLIK